MVESLTISDRVYRELRQMIVSGEIPPGTWLKQRQLAAQLGVSSMPVLEATRRLESDGLVEYHQKIGARVRTWDEDDVAGILLFREIMEATVAKLFVEKATPVQRLILVDYAEQFDAAAARGDAEACASIEHDLHMYVVKCSKSPTLDRYAESSRMLSVAVGNNPKRRSSVTKLVGVHEEFIKALTGDDPEAAAEAARKHVRSMAQNLTGSARKPRKERTPR